MANASARRSFHGPLLNTESGRGSKRRKAPPELAPTPSRPLELVPASPSASSIGRAVIAAARSEEPSTSQRQRVLAGVLAALQRLTSENE
jgi:hypothetical protein